MQLDALLSTIILVTFVVTVIMAVGSYVAYKLREGRRPDTHAPRVAGESPFFERLNADDIARATRGEQRDA
jgi:heme/copper-type cytochrome/quinol oxidase subunit 2